MQVLKKKLRFPADIIWHHKREKHDAPVECQCVVLARASQTWPLFSICLISVVGAPVAERSCEEG